MISITCSHCHAELQIDDAFAGGVCRCQHCGTIQTVPKQSAAKARRTPTQGVAKDQSDHQVNELGKTGALPSKRQRQKTIAQSKTRFSTRSRTFGAAVLLLLIVLLIWILVKR